MTLPIKSILWAPSNQAHHNHLHVEGDPRFTGTPPPNNPGMSDSVWTIWVALAERFGKPAYFLDDDAGDWTHMGWYNRRKIAGTTIWSQHSWSNALDIGPYYGVAQQQRFYDFLTGEDMALTPEVEKFVNDMYEAAVVNRGSNGSFAGHTVDHLRNHPSSGTTDTTARKIARQARDSVNGLLDKLRRV